MDALPRLRRLFRIGVAAAAVLLATAVVLIVFRESQFDRLRTEYAAVREAAVLVERYVEGGTVPDLPPAVEGFGIYDANGTPIVTAGSAPATIRPPREGDRLDRQNGRLRLVRPIGGTRPGPPVTPHEGPMTAAPGGPGASGPNRGLRRLPGFATQFVLLDYDLSVPALHQAWERGALVLAGVLTSGVLAIVVVLYRRLQGASRRAEEQRRLAQLGEAARTLAHEIKNPLTAAQMQTALLRRTTGDDQRPRIDALDEELRRIRHLTDQIRQFLRNGSGNPERLAAAQMVRAVAGRLGIEVELTGDESATVTFDRERLQSVVGNVLGNASEAHEAAEPIRVDIASRRERVVITVADRGPGIRADERSRVFDPFYTTKAHGSGVGLAVTQRFVEEAGGEISIDGRDGGGTVVTLVLKGKTS